MKIPALSEKATTEALAGEVEARKQFYNELIQKCSVSRANRQSTYNLLRSYYLFGTPDGRQARVNKIYSHIDTVSSFLFSQDATRFTVGLEEGAPESARKQVEAVAEHINDIWRARGADSVVAEGVKWSLVYNSAFIKIVPARKTVSYFFLDPGSFGVMNEGTTLHDGQEVMCHWYLISKTELERQLKAVNHPRIDAIMRGITGSRPQSTENLPEQVQAIALSQFSPTMQGYADLPRYGTDYEPKVDQDMVEMSELWIWDDDLDDYRVVTVASPGEIVFDRKNIFVPGENPFIKITPLTLPNYYWGQSETALLTPLQDLREKRLDQILAMWDKQAKPPKVFSGFSGIQDEKFRAMNTADGFIASSMPQATVQELIPQLPPETFAELNEIDRSFQEMSGVYNILQGRGEAGVRTQGQTVALANLASGRLKKRALTIEASLERLADLTLSALRIYDPTQLRDENGGQFICEQFTDAARIVVDGHSSSPIFADTVASMAFELFKARAIDRQSLIKMLRPPMMDALLERLDKIEAAEQKTAQEMKALEVAKIAGKAGM